MSNPTPKLPSARTVLKTAAIAAGTLIVLEALAMRGIFDWRDVANVLGGKTNIGGAPATAATGGN